MDAATDRAVATRNAATSAGSAATLDVLRRLGGVPTDAAPQDTAETPEALAARWFPGPPYREHLRALHAALRPAQYLEIGVFDGEALALAHPPSCAIGVDPAPRPAAWRNFAAATQIVTLTSDAFFARQAVEGAGALRIDLAFIDGLHVFEQVLRDFINVERHCHAGSVVVLHDTLPVTEAVAARERRTRFWCGDVWKMLPCLRRFRPELRICTVPTHPSGLTVVTGLDPRSRVLDDHYDAAVAAWLHAPVPRDMMPPAWLGDVANEPDEMCRWLQMA